MLLGAMLRTCRWDLAAAERLPNCMQICFKYLFEVTNDLSFKIYKRHGWNPIGSLRKAVYFEFIDQFSYWAPSNLEKNNVG